MREPVDKLAQKDINSSVDQSNIIQGRRRRAAYTFTATLEDLRTTVEALPRDNAPKQELSANVANTKWVHKKKQDAAGVFEKYKSRLVVQGFTQVEGIDYNETFALVVRTTTIKVIISIALAKGYIITQMDVMSACLNSKMDHNLIICILAGYELLDPDIDHKDQAL
ncbi:DNA-directed DNA polymerase [Chytriomyces confervae]|uniref:DNA-directed DNA polymerase n=1 Tax=Chytriomyces confervae TaxID=246404 RepID=A0A507ER95_9FUNG|nr:DNA-directed DNA polymerase [Chytriomyces confervae]